jgi:hypothetical protein
MAKITTQANYNKAVAKAWKAKTDAYMKKNWYTIKKVTKNVSSWWTATKNSNWTYTINSTSNNSSSSNNDARKQATARRKEAERKARYDNASKKLWGSANVLKAVEKQYTVNSPEYKKIRAEVARYSKWPAKIRENTVAPVATVAPMKPVISSNYKWNSVVDYLKSANKSSDFSDRQKLAKDLGVKNYKGTSTQNSELLDKMRANTSPSEDINTGGAEDMNEVDKIENAENIKDTISTEVVKENTNKNKEKLRQLRLDWKTDTDLLKNVEAKFGKDSEEYAKLKDFMDNNPLSDWTENIDETFKDKTKEEQLDIKIESEASKTDLKIAKTNENYIARTELLAEWNKDLVDFANKSILEIKETLATAKTNAQNQLNRKKDKELNWIVGRIRALLARRWIKIWNIPAEQLIAMSGDLWAQAMARIDDATTEMEISMLALSDAKSIQLRKLEKDWIITNNQYETSVQNLKEVVESNIQLYKETYTNNVMKLSAAFNADADKNNAEVLNTVSTFITQLGISWTAQWIMEEYMDAGDSVEALENMIEDLNDETSNLYKAVDDIQKAAELAVQFKAKLELMKATKAPARAAAPKTIKSQLSSTERSILSNNGYDPENYKTYADLNKLRIEDTELDTSLKKSAINVSQPGT